MHLGKHRIERREFPDRVIRRDPEPCGKPQETQREEEEAIPVENWPVRKPAEVPVGS